MSSKAQFFRNKKGLTQAELAEKSGLSLRTIQRIESGMVPRGHTLKSICLALEISSADLVDQVNSDSNLDTAQLKLINLCSLFCWVLPFGNIIIPSFLIYRQDDLPTRQMALNMLSVQILWTLLTSALLLLSPAMQVSLGIRVPLIFVSLFLMLSLNTFIIVRNAVALSKNGRPYILLKYSLL